MKAPTLNTSAVPALACADWLIDRAETVIAERGRCRIGLPGGRTAVALLDRLAERMPAELYAGLAITWTDERHLPLEDPASNYGLAQARWFGKAPAPVGHRLPLWRGGDLLADRTALALAFAEEFDSALDLCVLGVGEDGHVASIFPDHPMSLHADGAIAAVPHAPKPPPARLSLTLPVFNNAPYLALLAAGAHKNPALRAIAARDPALPASHLNPRGEYCWFLDAAAAQGLAERPSR